MRDYTKIDAWKLADDLVVEVYRLTQAFPRHELYGLTSQLRRAAASVPANIAEGSAREGKKDYLHVLHIARGSLAETQYFIHLARRLAYLAQADSERLIAATKRVFGCLHGLIGAVERECGQAAKTGALVISAAVLSLV